jgi:hypothetical protein
MTARAAPRGRDVDPLGRLTQRRILLAIAHKALAGDPVCAETILRLAREREAPATRLLQQDRAEV